ncbi:RelA/SpoT domain-containing protein [Brevibacterium casei]
MAWITRQYSKNQINKAGKLIGSGNANSQEVVEAREKVSNFRSAHAYPLLSVTIHVRKNALEINPDAVVARRLKRLPTIIDKLKRHPQMNVTTMHDLGGCRVILPNVAEVDVLVERLRGAKRAQNVITRSYDYLREPGPQDTGYRGVHLVYEYRATKQDFWGSAVEVQIRTELQHAWATAVETLDLFGGTRLKYGTGDDQLKRFFLVVSSLMAIHEGLPQPAAANDELAELRNEIKALENSLGILSRLSGYVAVVKQFGSDKRTTFLMQLDRKEKTLYLELFDNATGAEAKLEEIENMGDDNIDAVLVASSKVGMLRSAYPNYFANTSAFASFVQQQIEAN